MRIKRVIPSRRWRHRETGRMVSSRGACPWMTDAERQDWESVVVGWTWQLDDGTIGLGRVPAKTETEALRVMSEINRRHEQERKMWDDHCAQVNRERNSGPMSV